MTTTLPLLVVYDGSVDARRALTWTARESLRTGVPVHVLAVNEVLTPTWGGVGGSIVVTEGYVLDSSALLEEAAKTLAEEGVTEVTAEQRTGAVVPELVQAAASASTLILGSSGHGAAGEALLGSVSQHLARHATCPVVVVREPRDPDARRIIVGIDGSGSSSAALDYACRRAETTGETVVAVPPGRCLADASASASLVVVGSRGLGWFSGLLLGSVSQAVLHRATCPVIVVR